MNAFGKVGRLITKRKWSIIAVWILLLAIILPIVVTATGVTSMTMEASTDSGLESSLASDIIKAQFQKSVSNDSLVLVISTDDASSIDTQRFIDELTNQLNQSSRVSGIKNITSVYSILIPALNQTNQAAYLIYNNGNLTYNLLYSVPTIYSKVWETAYNTAVKDNLIPGLDQTNQGIYALIPNANMTYNFLYGVPAMYSGVWSGAYNQTLDTLSAGLNQTSQGVYAAYMNGNLTYNLLYATPAMYLNYWSTAIQSHSVTEANQIAYDSTATALQYADPVAYAQYTSHLLDIFNASWAQSFLDPATSAWTPIERATFASTQTNNAYINTFLAGNATNQAFATALTDELTFTDYLANNQTLNIVKLENFAIEFVTNSSGGQSSPEFVTAAYNLGANPSASALASQAEAIIWSPDTYKMGTDFISTFNEVAYNQTRDMLQAADPASYAQYTALLLNAYNTTWTYTFQNPALQAQTVTYRASLAANITNEQYINTAFADNATARDFFTALTHSFSLETYLANINNQAKTNNMILDFSLRYIANQSGQSMAFITAAYNLGANPSNSSLASLANNIVWHSSNYGFDNFISTFNKVSYDQTAKILREADAKAYNDYTSHLLNYFNASWATHIPSSPGYGWINQLASNAADDANAKFIDNYLSDNRDFAEAVADTFTLQDYLDANSTRSNAKLYDLTISYLSGQSGLSEELIAAIYDMGENATNIELQTLASKIVANPDLYNVGEQFELLLTSFVSPSRDVTLISITFDESDDDNLVAIREMIADKMAADPKGINSVEITGTDAINFDFRESTYADLELILPVTIALLVIATGLFFRSIVTPIITLGTIGVGLGVSQIFPYLVGTYINQVDYTISTVLLTVLIGVGTDYSIFILARHREERINGLPVFEAIKQSITWAGESIVTSGVTVIISFFALAGTSMVMMQTMGLIVGLGVIVTLLASLTFAPALTAILGDRIFWPNSGDRFERYAKRITQRNHQRGGYFAKSGSFSVKHGKAIILLSIIVTVPAFYVYATTTPTYNMLGSASDTLESVSASNTMTDSFGGGRLMPSYVVVTFSEPIIDGRGNFNMGELATLQRISGMIADHEGVQEVTSTTMPFGNPVDYQTITNDSDATTYTTMLDSIGADNKSALITVRFSMDPYSTEAMNHAQDIRNTLHSQYDTVENVTGTYLGGTTGGTLDTKATFDSQFSTILPIVALGVGIVLFFVLGSLILPVFAILSVLMSIVWTLAVTMIVFQGVFSYGLLFITPLILFVLLLGIGMDYNIFILTRIREEAAKGAKLNDAIVNAIQQTGGIITAAAIILAGSLGALLLSSNMMLREMGFAFAFSILIDALVVRTYLVPAVMATFGKWNWYNPIKRLRRMDDTKKAAG